MARVAVASFRREHVPAAARMLAERQREARRVCPALPEFEAGPAAVLELRAAAARFAGRGVVGGRSGHVEGFLNGHPLPAEGAGPDRSILMPVGGHGADAEAAYELYGSMYSALAAVWVAADYRTHLVDVLAPDEAALSAWCALGFGQQSVFGVRDCGRVPGAGIARDVEIRPAGGSDWGSVARFVHRLAEHHQRAPIFASGAAVTGSIETELAGRLLDESAPIWLAWRDAIPTGVVGVQTRPVTGRIASPEQSFAIDLCFTEPDARGTGIALLRQAMAWGRQRGLARCVTSWRSANQPSALLCRALGFRPLMYRLERTIA